VHVEATWQIRLNDCARWLSSESATGVGDAAFSQITLANLVGKLTTQRIGAYAINSAAVLQHGTSLMTNALRPRVAYSTRDHVRMSHSMICSIER